MKKLDKNNNMLFWLILAILGILTIIFRKQVKDVLYIIAGAALMLGAVITAINWFKTRPTTKEGIIQLVGAALVFAVGLWILCNPTAFDRLVNVVIGLILIVCGCMWLYRAYQAKDKITMILAGIAIIFGIIIAVSGSATSWVVIAAGIGLIYTAVTGIFAEMRIK